MALNLIGQFVQCESGAKFIVSLRASGKRKRCLLKLSSV